MTKLQTTITIFAADEEVPEWVLRVEGAAQSNLKFEQKTGAIPIEGCIYLLPMGLDSGKRSTTLRLEGVHEHVTLIGSPTIIPGDMPKQIRNYIPYSGHDIQ